MEKEEVITGEKELDVADLTEVEDESTEQVTEKEQHEELDTTSSNLTEGQKKQIDEKQDEKQQNENSKFAEVRRKAEEEGRLKSKTAYEKGLKEGRLNALKGKINPYTNTVIEDENDIEIYENMYALSQDGKDPITDYPSYIAEKQREKEQQQTAKREAEEKAQKDVDEFISKYPNVDLTSLLKDEIFTDYIDGKNKSLCELYESYKKMENQFRNKGVETAKQTIANSLSSPGGLSSDNDTHIDYSKMSREEFLKEVEKVKSGI